MIVGTIISSIALFLMSISPSMGWLTFSFLLLSIALNMVLPPYSALVPDVVPKDQRGQVSSWLGGMMMLGSITSGVIAYYLTAERLFGAYFIIIIINALCMAITCYNTIEIPIEEIQSPITPMARCRSFIAPFYSHDFRVIFFARFVFQMGINTVTTFLQFYLEEAIGPDFYLSGVQVAKNVEQAQAILLIPVTCGALISSLTSGFLSDWFGGKRKVIVYVAGGMMAFACALFALTRSYALDMVTGLVFGCGYGAFSVMEWALATDILPNPTEFAKDMGVWSLALVLPQVICLSLGGVLLDYFQGLAPGWNLGYTVVFLMAFCYFAIGTWFVKYLDAVS